MGCVKHDANQRHSRTVVQFGPHFQGQEQKTCKNLQKKKKNKHLNPFRWVVNVYEISKASLKNYHLNTRQWRDIYAICSQKEIVGYVISTRNVDYRGIGGLTPCEFWVKGFPRYSLGKWRTMSQWRCQKVVQTKLRVDVAWKAMANVSETAIKRKQKDIAVQC